MSKDEGLYLMRPLDDGDPIEFWGGPEHHMGRGFVRDELKLVLIRDSRNKPLVY